jgi:hypothetical protein
LLLDFGECIEGGGVKHMHKQGVNEGEGGKEEGVGREEE